MKRMGLIQQKKGHYITSLLHYCAFLLRELALCFFYFITHSLCYLSLPFSCKRVPSLTLCYTPFTTCTPSIEPVSAFCTFLSCPFGFFQLIHLYISFLFPQHNESVLEPSNSLLELIYVFSILAEMQWGEYFVCVAALVLFNLSRILMQQQCQRASCVLLNMNYWLTRNISLQM